MDIDSCYRIGYVMKRHGLKGDVKIRLESSLPQKLESIFVEINNRLVPFFIEQISVLNDVAILKLEDVNGPDQADKLVRHGVYLENSKKPKSKSKQLETNELIGFLVHTDAQELGTVISINDHALNPLLVVSKEGHEMLIPISDYFIKRIDRKKKNIEVELPDGFTEI